MSLFIDIQKQLGDFSLQTQFRSENDRLALLGGSGCGKSVTLRCIAGVMQPDEGIITLNGKVLFDSAKKINLPPQARHIGYLFQQYALFPNMTVAQNIKVAVRDRNKRDETAQKLLHTFQIENIAAKHPAQVSGGQQQRIALARIIASEPEVLMLDEPFSALDSFLKAQLEQELADVLDTFPGDVIWVSHDRDEVFHNCNKICVMENGISQGVVTPDQLFYDPKTASAAKLSGCKNIIPVVAQETRVEIPCWNISFRCTTARGGSISHIGLRAHHIHFCSAAEENAFPCAVVRAMDNVFSIILTLRPTNAEQGAPTLRMEVSKELWAAQNGATQVCVCIAPENILLLR